MVSEFGEDGMGLEYKVWQLPIDQRAILINPQKGTAGSASGIDKMQSKDKAGWEYCMIMLIKATSSHGPRPAAGHRGLGFWFLLSPPLPLFSGLASVSNQHVNSVSVNLFKSNDS